VFSFSVLIVNYSCNDSFFYYVFVDLLITAWVPGIFFYLYLVCDLNVTDLCHNFQCECGFADSVRNL